MKKIITIYQPKIPTFRVNKEENLYFIDNFNTVFREENEVESTSEENDKVLLEQLFARFNNGNYPENYTGHSLSVGDIVRLQLTDSGDPMVASTYEDKAYICCNFGWKEVEITTNRDYLESADTELYNQMVGY